MGTFEVARSGRRRATKVEVARLRARDRRYRWARRFRPAEIDLLLVAEAPPGTLERYFYLPDVELHDSLFRECARAILRREPTRKNKAELLGLFRDRGVFLIDACLDALDGPLRIDTGRLVTRIRRLKPRRIIIVKIPVFDSTYTAMVEAGLPVINARIPFPGSGQQVRFHTEMRLALRKRPPARLPLTASTGIVR